MRHTLDCDLVKYPNCTRCTCSPLEPLTSNPNSDLNAGYCAGYDSAKVDLAHMKRQADEIERLRALLQMAEDCLPDGDYSIRAMAAKEIREALRPADETSPVTEARIHCGGCRRDLTLTIRGLEKDGDKLVGFHCRCGHVTALNGEAEHP